MDMKIIAQRASEGEKLSRDEIESAIRQLPDERARWPSDVIADVGQNHPEYLAEFSAELGAVRSCGDDMNAHRVMEGLKEAIISDPSIFADCTEFIQFGLTERKHRFLYPAVESIIVAERAGENLPDELFESVTAGIAQTTDESVIALSTTLFESLVSAENADNTEAFHTILGLVNSGRQVLVDHFGDLLVDITLQEDVPEGANVEDTIRVLEGFQEHLPVPAADVQSAIDILERK